MNPFKDNITRTKRLALALLAGFVEWCLAEGAGAVNRLGVRFLVSIRFLVSTRLLPLFNRA